MLDTRYPIPDTRYPILKIPYPKPNLFPTGKRRRGYAFSTNSLLLRSIFFKNFRTRSYFPIPYTRYPKPNLFPTGKRRRGYAFSTNSLLLRSIFLKIFVQDHIFRYPIPDTQNQIYSLRENDVGGLLFFYKQFTPTEHFLNFLSLPTFPIHKTKFIPYGKMMSGVCFFYKQFTPTEYFFLKIFVQDPIFRYPKPYTLYPKPYTQNQIYSLREKDVGGMLFLQTVYSYGAFF
jgi:hypothetical protein